MHRRPRASLSRAFAGTAGAVLAAGLLVACGGDSSTAEPAESAAPTASAPRDRFLAASARSLELNTAKFDMTMVMHTAAGDEIGSMSGEGELRSEPVEMRMSMTLPGEEGAFELVVVGDRGYERGTGEAPADKWVSVSPDDLAATGIDPEANDPAAMLARFAESTGDITEDGVETIDGVETTKYVGELDLDEWLGDAGAATGPDDVEVGGTYPFEIYLDGDDRVVRMVMTMAVSGLGEEVTATSTSDYYDWGAEVDIQAPDEADVVTPNGR